MSGSGSPTLTFTGSQTDVNKALALVSYQPNGEFEGQDTLTFTAVTNDTANGTTSTATSTTSVTIDVNPVAEPPTASAPPTATTSANTAIDISGIVAGPTAEDADDTIIVLLTVTHGTLAVSPVAGVTETVNGPGSLTVSGTASDVNTALASLVYTPTTNFTGSDTLNVSVTSMDGSNTYPTQATAATAITISATTDTLNAVHILPGGILDWNDPANWSNGLPTLGTNVAFDPSTANFTVEITSPPDAQAESLTISHGAATTDITVSGTLQLAGNLDVSNSGKFTNNGILEETANGTFLGPIANNGTIIVDPNVYLDVTGIITGTGKFWIDSNATLEFALGSKVAPGTTDSQTIYFEQGAGKLIIDDWAKFAGVITGTDIGTHLTSTDLIDLTQLPFGGSMSASVSYNSGTNISTITFSDGISANNVTLHFSGNYKTGTTWTFTSINGGTGTEIHDPPADSGTVTVDSGATVEIAAASAATIDFANGSGTNGSLVLDNSQNFVGQIVGFTGDGTAVNSDSIDLKDVNFASLIQETYTENSAGTGGTLTVSDGTHTANIEFIGNYELANFKFASDGSGGTLIIDPATSTTTTDTSTVIADASTSRIYAPTTTTDASTTTIDASTATADGSTATPDITASPGVRTSTLTPTEGASSSRIRATAAAIDESIMVALSTAAPIALSTAASASDGSEPPTSNSGDDTAVDITGAVSRSESSQADSGAAAKFSPASHLMAGNGAVGALDDKPEIAGPVAQTGMFQIEATPQPDGFDATSALVLTDGTNAGTVNLQSDYTINTAHNFSNEGREGHGSKAGHDSPASATGEPASLQSSSADSDLIVSSPQTLSGNGAHSASPLNANLDHRAISDLDSRSIANNQLLQQTANNKAAYLDDNSLLRSDGGQPANVHFDISQLANFKFADDNGNHFGSIAHDPPALGLGVLSNDVSGTHEPDAPAHAAAKEASALSTPPDSHFIADGPFTEPLGGNGRHSAIQQDFEHRAIADPEIGSITKNQLLEFASNSLHMPAQLDDGGVLMTDRAHATHLHADENPLGNVKLPDDGSYDSGRIVHDPPGRDLAAPLSDASRTHGPDAPTHAGGKDAAVQSTSADTHLILGSPSPETPSVNGDHFRFPPDFDQHAIAEPETNSVAKNQLSQEPANNSPHMPAQLDDSGALVTDGAHPAHPHFDENQLPNFKFADDGATHPGAIISDAPTLTPTLFSGEPSGNHAPAAPAIANAFESHGTGIAHAASEQIGSDQFVFGKSVVPDPIPDFKTDMTEVDHPTIVEIQHLLDVAHETSAASPLDPHHGTAPQDTAKAHHLDQFHFV